jgi:hypothetical protein
LDRLSAQIHALEASSEVGPVSGTSRELLDLLRRQLDLLRRMRLECEMLVQKRERSFSQLRGLWQQSSAMRDAGAGSSEARARMRELLEQSIPGRPGRDDDLLEVAPRGGSPSFR